MDKKIQYFSWFGMSYFRKTVRRPDKLVKCLKKTLRKLNGNKKKAERANKKIWKYLEEVKDTIFGIKGEQPSTEQIQKLADELYKSDLISLLIQKLSSVSFESKKSIAVVYNYFLQFPKTVDYLCSKPEILFTLLKGYENPDISLNCGSMLQESFNIESLTRIILYSEDFFKLFEYIDTSIFHVSSDAFNTLKALLTQHKNLCSDFLYSNYEKVFTNYDRLLQSENYVVQWQSLKLLSEILRDRKYSKVMNKFTTTPVNLKLVLSLLKRKSRNIQYEAFNVFLIFVVNPDKTNEIVDILFQYKDKLVKLLKDFQEDRPDDSEFHQEKRFLIQIIKDLKPLS